MADKQAKERLESVARHLIKDEPKSERPKFELEDHPIDEIRKLRVSSFLVDEKHPTDDSQGGGDWGRHFRNHSWNSAASQGTRNRFDHFGKE